MFHTVSAVSFICSIPRPPFRHVLPNRVNNESRARLSAFFAVVVVVVSVFCVFFIFDYASRLRLRVTRWCRLLSPRGPPERSVCLWRQTAATTALLGLEVMGLPVARCGHKQDAFCARFVAYAVTGSLPSY